MSGETHFDTIVVGSGFGGSVSAYRLAQAGQRVCVLERGKAYPPESFPRRPREMANNFWDPSRGLHGLFNIWSFRAIEAVVASGLGGGSLIYANVLLRKDEKWFVTEDPFDGGYERWPITRADLEPHYDEVERMLQPQRYPLASPGFDDTAKTLALRDAAVKLGLDWQLPNLGITFANDGAPPRIGEPIPPGAYPNLHGPHAVRTTCRLTGECDLGCNYGSKNTLDHNYLSAAKHLGAEIRTRSEVRRFSPRARGGYTVSYVEHHPDREGKPTKTAKLPAVTITADRLILAAGTLGSTYLLLRNRSAFPGIGDALGTRFSGNGDFLGFLLRSHDTAGGGTGRAGTAGGGTGRAGTAGGGTGRAGTAGDDGATRRVLDGSRGPVITSFVRLPDAHDAGGTGGPSGPSEGDTRRGAYIEDAGFPGFVDWMLETTTVPSTAARAVRFALRRLWGVVTRNPRSDLSGEIAGLIGTTELSAGSLPLLGMGRDTPDGVIGLRKNQLDVNWNMATSEEFFAQVRKTMIDISEQLGATYRDNPLRTLKRLVTVHPLGGCPMGRDASEGVVDAWGQVYGHPGLYVADGAAMPGSVGANPSLTIAAFADRMAERIIEGTPTTQQARPAATTGTAPPVPVQAATSLEFTEEMKGFVTFGELDYQRGFEAGKRDGTFLMFHLTIGTDDVDRFVADADHAGSARGWVECDRLGGRLTVDEGLFNLFVDGDDPSRTWMRYRLFLTGPAGEALTMSGFKDVKDDPGFDLWADTSTLYTRVRQGHVIGDQEAGGDILASGILRIYLADFATQLTTFRTQGPSPGARAGGLADFGRLFLGKLWDIYAPLAVAQEKAAPTGAPADG